MPSKVKNFPSIKSPQPLIYQHNFNYTLFSIIITSDFGVLGLCLEKKMPTLKTKYKIAELHEQIIKCFETAGDLTLVYLQELDKLVMQMHNGTTITNNNSIGKNKTVFIRKINN